MSAGTFIVRCSRVAALAPTVVARSKRVTPAKAAKSNSSGAMMKALFLFCFVVRKLSPSCQLSAGYLRHYSTSFSDRAAIELPRFSVPTPFPNTGLYRQLKRAGRLLSEDWTLYDEQHVVFRPSGMSPERLHEGFLHTWKEAYRLSSIASRLMTSSAFDLGTILQVTLPASIGFRFFGRGLPGHVRLPPKPAEVEEPTPRVEAPSCDHRAS